jgi:hypothetical protein
LKTKHPKKRIGLHRLIERITTDAGIESIIRNRNRPSYRPRSKDDMPGYRIMQLKPEEREALSHATAKDFSWRGFK